MFSASCFFVLSFFFFTNSNLVATKFRNSSNVSQRLDKRFTKHYNRSITWHLNLYFFQAPPRRGGQQEVKNILFVATLKDLVAFCCYFQDWKRLLVDFQHQVIWQNCISSLTPGCTKIQYFVVFLLAKSETIKTMALTAEYIQLDG